MNESANFIIEVPVIEVGSSTPFKFCGEHNIVSEIEMIKMQEINEAYERMLKSDVRYRFVIDMKSLS